MDLDLKWSYFLKSGHRVTAEVTDCLVGRACRKKKKIFIKGRWPTFASHTQEEMLRTEAMKRGRGAGEGGGRGGGPRKNGERERDEISLLHRE